MLCSTGILTVTYLLILCHLATSLPTRFVPPHQLIAYSPPIQSPEMGDFWSVGQRRHVVWDTSRIPPEIQNTTGLIILGRLNTTDENEHLDLYHPLAKDFSIMDGTQSVIVPDVEPSNDYIVVLFGDSGNASGKFTISKHRF